MVLAAIQLPQITISSAPPDAPLVEPFSPFSSAKPTLIDDDDINNISDDDSYRPRLLTPPSTHLKFSPSLPSPLGPTAMNKASKGLERDRFEALLKATRERNAYSQGKRDGDLRKEIALKQHKNKQVERRALFLSKVLAPPSPTAATQPKTPPDSPALFHFRFPSPGLVSPLALFESLNEDSPSGPLSYPVNPWVEQVDYRLPYQKLQARKEEDKSKIKINNKPTNRAPKSLPSLEQISARLGGGSNHVRTPSAENAARATRLPGFLRQAPASGTAAAVKPNTSVSVSTGANVNEDRPRLSFGSGRRLQLPIHTPKPSKAEYGVPVSVVLTAPPKSPSSPLTPELQVTTQVVPRSSSSSPTELTELNLQAWESRERRAKDMLSTLRRRTTSTGLLPSDDGMNGHEVNVNKPSVVLDRRWKRHSAPAEIAPRPRVGFEHPVLALKGAF